MIPIPNLSFADSSSLTQNPAGALLAGGFVFGGARQLGGSGNRQEATANPTASLSQPIAAPVAGWEDAGMLYGPTIPAPGSSSSNLLPLAILGAAVLVALAIRR